MCVCACVYVCVSVCMCMCAVYTYAHIPECIGHMQLCVDNYVYRYIIYAKK